MLSVFIVLIALAFCIYREEKRQAHWYGDTVYAPLLDVSNLQANKKGVAKGSLTMDLVIFVVPAVVLGSLL